MIIFRRGRHRGVTPPPAPPGTTPETPPVPANQPALTRPGPYWQPMSPGHASPAAAVPAGPVTGRAAVIRPPADPATTATPPATPLATAPAGWAPPRRPRLGDREQVTDSTNLLHQITDLCEAYARHRVTRTLAEAAETSEEHRHLNAQADYWNSAVDSQYQALVTVVETALPEAAAPAGFMPVRLRPAGGIELHSTDQRGRPMVVTMSGQQALALGVHLTALAAMNLDRAGTKVTPALPVIPADPTMHAATRAAGPAPVAA